MVFFSPLASGSKGNSILIGYGESKILVDVGISFKELERRCRKIGVSFDDIDAILVTHEHKDHIEGLCKIVQRYNIPVVCNLQTAKGIYNTFPMDFDFRIFTTEESFSFLGFQIFPFSLQHDAAEPVGYIIGAGEKKIGICTDVGFVTSLLKRNLKGCDLLYIESNHDRNMLAASRRPEVLKRRIMGRQGHLSNGECADLIKAVLDERLKIIYLAHISRECNSEERAFSVISEVLEGREVSLFFAKQEDLSTSSTLY